MKQYFFILGFQPDLSIAELDSVFKLEEYKLGQNKRFLISALPEFKAQDLMLRLGGTIKIGQIMKVLPAKQASAENLAKQIFSAVNSQLLKQTKKIMLGLNVYDNQQWQKQKLALGLKLKKLIKEQGLNCRLVTSKEPELSSVVVKTNKLLTEGMELNLFFLGQEIHLGQTLAVQPFAELSARDYGRPARDDRSGMMPPKLAQMLINLTVTREIRDPKPETRNPILLDPFCGSGTILQEAALLGFKNLIGSDISAQAIADTKRNLDWLKTEVMAGDNQVGDNGHYRLPDWPEIKLIHSDIRVLPSKPLITTVDFIVTEPYLGPPEFTAAEVPEIINDLKPLYLASFKVFQELLNPDGRVGIIMPVLSLGNQQQGLNLSQQISQLGFKDITPLKSPLIYHRPGQRVWRQIMVWQK